MELVVSNLIGFVVGLTASWVFLKWQLSLRPKISISPQAAYSTDRHTFRVKVANDGKRQVTDIRAKLSILKRKEYKNRALQLVVRKLPLRTNIDFALAGQRERGEPWGLLYARTFVSQSDEEAFELLQSPVGEERRLVFTIEAVDAISGTKVVRRVAYRPEDVVIDGKFGKGLVVIES